MTGEDVKRMERELAALRFELDQARFERDQAQAELAHARLERDEARKTAQGTRAVLHDALEERPMVAYVRGLRAELAAWRKYGGPPATPTSGPHGAVTAEDVLRIMGPLPTGGEHG